MYAEQQGHRNNGFTAHVTNICFVGIDGRMH